MKDLRLTLNWVAENMGVEKCGLDLARLGQRNIAGISIDSRTVAQGEVFVALAGNKFDGHDYAVQALKRGALALVTQRPLAGEVASQSFIVSDPLRALGDLARALRLKQQIKVVAVTGSNGKTSTKDMLAAILKRVDGNVVTTRGNFNNLIGVPLTLFRLSRRTQLAVLEMGMNRFGEISRLTYLAQPDVGLITSVGPAHLEFFGTVSQVARAKGELYAGLPSESVAVVNADEPLLRREAKHFAGNCLYFGIDGRAEVRLGRVSFRGFAGQTLILYGPGAEKGRRVRLNFLGRHNAHNALAAAAAALAVGANWDQISEGLEEARYLNGRLAGFKTNNGQWVLDDSYNANPASVEAGLKVLAELKNKGRRGAILGDMLELGLSGPELHRQVGRLAAALKLDFLALVGPLSRITAAAAKRAGLSKNEVREFENPEQAAAWVAVEGGHGAVVLVKASQSMGLERAVDYLRNGASPVGKVI